jgi:hypothetical protein
MNRLNTIKANPTNHKLPQNSPAAFRIARIDLECVERFASARLAWGDS